MNPYKIVKKRTTVKKQKCGRTSHCCKFEDIAEFQGSLRNQARGSSQKNAQCKNLSYKSLCVFILFEIHLKDLCSSWMDLNHQIVVACLLNGPGFLMQKSPTESAF